MGTINRWDALPDESKSMILSRLSTKEVARIARVSKEFLRAVHVLRSSVQLLVLPPNLPPSALEGMVIAHPNLKSLSFKRCGKGMHVEIRLYSNGGTKIWIRTLHARRDSGKLKTFLPIIKAAATGFVTVTESDGFDAPIRDKNKTRSLTSIDFRNCMNLIDTDVSILCSLHTRLDEINLTNCQFMTDTALLTLSRYQHVEKPIDPLEKYTCYPRVFDKASKPNTDAFTESEEMFLKDNDAAVFEEIQGLGLSSNNFRSWPRLGDRSRKEFGCGHSQFSGRRHDEGKTMAASPYSAITKRDTNANLGCSTGLKKSYAQMAAKSLGKPTPTSTHCEVENIRSPYNLGSPQLSEDDFALSSIDRVDAGPSKGQSSKQSSVDPGLTFIDWSLSGLEKPAKPQSDALTDMGLLTVSDHHSNVSSLPDVDERLDTEIAAANRYRDMYKRYLIDEVEKPARVLPELIDKLCLNAVDVKDFSQCHFGSTLPTASIPSGTNYNISKTSTSDKQMMRTQASLFIPKVPFHNLDGNNGLAKQKAVCVADGTETRDQRVQVDHPQQLPSSGGQSPPESNSEAYCRTVNHVGIFAIPNVVSKSAHLSDAVDEIHEGASNYVENGRFSSLEEERDRHPHQLNVSRPDVASAASVLRKVQQGSQSPGSPTETVVFADRSDATDPHLDLDETFSRTIPGLRTVSVASCPEITDRGIQALLRGTSRTCLSTLDVSRCGGVTNAGLKLPTRSGLQHLIAIQMPAINRLVYQLPSHSVLHHINLAGCQKVDYNSGFLGGLSLRLEELILVAPSLKTVNLSNCKKLARLHLKCPSLTGLNLSLCDSLERFAKFQCNALRALNATGCRMLSQSALNAVLDSAGDLEDLRCGGCDHMERLDLVHSALLTVEVSGNQSLKRLYCRSKVLRVVDACGCKNLAEVYLYSPYLRRMLFSNCALLHVLVIPLDAIKETIDASASQRKWAGGKKPDELEISISGCNMPEPVKKNLAKLAKQWQACFRLASEIVS